nr:hypothetical protein [uncultured Cohaesibacter sp.]
MSSSFLDWLEELEMPFRAESGVCFGRDVAAALAYFDRLTAPKISGVSGATVIVSRVQSGLGNRETMAMQFESRAACSAFVDQLAQRAIEGRAQSGNRELWPC